MPHTLRSWALRLALLAFVLSLAWFTIASLSPWPVPVVVRHYLASEGCSAASAVGLAPSRRGEPGYWSRLDGDKDGIACELWSPDGRRVRP